MKLNHVLERGLWLVIFINKMVKTGNKHRETEHKPKKERKNKKHFTTFQPCFPLVQLPLIRKYLNWKEIL
jgi:hypothetical protein